MLDTTNSRPEPPRRGDPLLNAVVRERAVERKRDVLRQGEVPHIAHILLEGHTYRYRLLSDGKRQITAILVPGDLCDLEAAMRGRADYGVAALTPCRLGEIPVERLKDPGEADPEIARALCRHLLRDEAIAREWLVNLGRRSALQRIAHLFCELRVRLRAIGLATEDDFAPWLRQPDLADMLGLTTVHVNRVLQAMRADGLIQLKGRRLTILDARALEQIAGFEPGYLV